MYSVSGLKKLVYRLWFILEIVSKSEEICVSALHSIFRKFLFIPRDFVLTSFRVVLAKFEPNIQKVNIWVLNIQRRKSDG